MNLYDQRRALFPLTTTLAGEEQSLSIAGCSVTALAAEYGTPLYVFDEATLDASVDEYRSALAVHPVSYTHLTLPTNREV